MTAPPSAAPAASLVPEEPFESADAFLDALAPRHAAWDPDPQAWVFRGHADARWQLLPSVLRNDVRLGYYPGAPRGPRDTHGDQIRAEIGVLFEFLRTANDHGMMLPPVAEQIWSAEGGEIENIIANSQRPPLSPGDAWPRRQWMPLLALAQHYGIPTRLLDWTGQSRVAAYFAAERAARWVHGVGDPPAGLNRIEVWAVRTSLVAGLTRNTIRGPEVEFRSVLRSSNPNLHAQHGVFSVAVDHRVQMYEPPTRTPLDQIVMSSLQAENTVDGLHVTPTAALLRRLSLPSEEAPRLLRQLNVEGVSASSIYPGYAAAASTLDDRRYFSPLV